MTIGGVGSQQSVQVEQTPNIGGNAAIGNGLGGHQAQVGEAKGRGIGQMITNAFQSIGKTLSNFLAKIGQLFSPRQSIVTQMKGQFKNYLEENIKLTSTPKDKFVTDCTQDMVDAAPDREVLKGKLNNPDFSSEKFTGIEDHPSDPSKFITKFGENKLEFSNRSSSNGEFRSDNLKQKLGESKYENLAEMIGQSHMTKDDSLLCYATNLAVNMLHGDINSENMSPKDRVALRQEIATVPVGDTTVGEVMDLSRLES
ncbi:MAG: hypothetical protein JEZ12_19635 [Desulfobacterium sp.]|nr:hypothetical protein [Desulfobacterium sp.]